MTFVPYSFGIVFKVITTDTNFSSTKSIEGFYCAQVFFGMTSKTLYVAGMKTESEFPDGYLHFIRQHGIPSALRRDNAKSVMSQRVCQIHRDLVIADQWTEPYSPWQNPAELNGVKYLKSHAQVLLDRTGAPDSMCPMPPIRPLEVSYSGIGDRSVV
jgi:hypothetical protein